MSIETFTPKDSSFIESVGCSSLALILVVHFKSGSLWAYTRVSGDTYRSLISSSSLGNYFNLYIRDTHYSYQISPASQSSKLVNIVQKTQEQEQT